MGVSRLTTLIGDIDAELMGLDDCKARALRAGEIIAALKSAEKEARRRRNKFIRALCDTYGPAETYRMLGGMVSHPTVKVINRR